MVKQRCDGYSYNRTRGRLYNCMNNSAKYDGKCYAHRNQKIAYTVHMNWNHRVVVGQDQGFTTFVQQTPKNWFMAQRGMVKCVA